MIFKKTNKNPQVRCNFLLHRYTNSESNYISQYHAKKVLTLTNMINHSITKRSRTRITKVLLEDILQLAIVILTTIGMQLMTSTSLEVGFLQTA